MHSKVAVIIPAYNAEKTLGRAVESVLSQTLHDVEVWIVDDGSSDGTGRIADDLAKCSERVNVIHQKNAGPYAARIAGVKSSTAPYIAFVDADDSVEPEMYERLLNFSEEYDLDVAQCTCVGAGDVGRPTELYLSKEAIRENVIEQRLFFGAEAAYVWGKLYKRGVWANKFESSNIMMFEDLKINLQVFRAVNRYGCLYEGLYRYQINDGSSVRNYNGRHIENLCEMIDTRRRASAWFGIDSEDARMHEWVVKNVHLNVIVAATAKVGSWGERKNYIDTLFGLQEYKNSCKIVHKHLLLCMKDKFLFISLLFTFGDRIGVLAIRILRKSIAMLKNGG